MSVTSISSELNTDVAVVGGGGSGLMAALSAAKSGARVIVLEKNASLGGTTALSVGTISASSTRLQRAASIDDSPDSHFQDMEKFMGPLVSRDNLALRRLLVDKVPEAIAVLEELGVTFMGPLPEPPHSQPRLHAVVPHSRSFIRHLEKACRDMGVTILTNARVSGLQTHSGSVCGLELEACKRHVKVARGVILASGDFSSASVDYKRQYMSGPLLQAGGINATSTGDGQKIAEAIGAEVVNGDLAWGPEIRFTAPPNPSIVSRMPTHKYVAKGLLAAMDTLPQWVLRPILLRFVTTFLAPSLRLFEEGAILVNKNGHRFCDERVRPQDAICAQPDQTAWIVMDNATAQRFAAWPNFVSTAPGVGYAYLSDYASSRPDIYATAPDLAGAASKAGLPAAAVEESVATYNAELAVGDPRQPIQTGPYHVLGPARSWIVFSEGGLRIDESFRVLDKARSPIPGLFAAGSAGQGGAILEGHGHHLAWAFVSGLLAGRTAARSAGG
ncbi:FAD-dependent oxidoreductase [Seohaeicola saemankumensis]|uniref:FAD-dependent oxidoreductase n=1 Tax=Seohaeicola saemankumensis TaxID=481181 RepID=UPI0035CE9B9A